VAATGDWWGDFTLEEERSALWRAGTLALRVTRQQSEWRMAWRSEPDEAAPAMTATVPAEDLDDTWELRRYGFSTTTAVGRLVPALSDRTIVSRPAIPVAVPPGQSIDLVVTTPLWLRAECEGLAINELPTLRLSDTWFGASTREGQLCYAARTHLRPARELGEVSGWRALTTVRVINRAADTLVVERLALPVPRLALYRHRDAFWTSTITLERPLESSEEAQVTVDPAPPGPGAVRIGEPRETADEHPVSRVFNSLFG